MAKLVAFNPFGSAVDYSEISTTAKNLLLLHRKVFTDNTTRTTTSSSWTDLGFTFNLTAPVNSLVVSVFLLGISVTNDNTQSRKYTLVATGTNLGTTFVREAYVSYFSTTDRRFYRWDTGTMQEAGYLTANDGLVVLPVTHPIKLLDATTGFRIYAQSGNSKTAGLRNVQLIVLYVPVYVED